MLSLLCFTTVPPLAPLYIGPTIASQHAPSALSHARPAILSRIPPACPRQTPSIDPFFRSAMPLAISSPPSTCLDRQMAIASTLYAVRRSSTLINLRRTSMDALCEMGVEGLVDVSPPGFPVPASAQAVRMHRPPIAVRSVPGEGKRRSSSQKHAQSVLVRLRNGHTGQQYPPTLMVPRPITHERECVAALQTLRRKLYVELECHLLGFSPIFKPGYETNSLRAPVLDLDSVLQYSSGDPATAPRRCPSSVKYVSGFRHTQMQFMFFGNTIFPV